MIKERLRGYRDRKREIMQLDELLTEMEAQMMSPRIQQLTGSPGNPSPDNDTITDMVAKHMQLQDRYTQLMTELMADQIVVEQLIASLAPRERELMRLRYIQGLKWEDICVRMHYSWRQIHRAHAKALRQLEDGKK